MPKKIVVTLFAIILIATAGLLCAQNPLDGITCYPPVHIITGIHPDINYYAAPSTIRSIYSLPTTGGTGTIAIIDAYDNPSIQNDFNAFSSQFGLLTASALNFEIHKMSPTILLATTGNWNIEGDLDVQWAHAIAPNCKILFIEATSSNLGDLLAGVSYAASRSDVVAISMSFGATEFSTETAYDNTFTSAYGAGFFASSGDDGAGVQYPAASPNVIAVGGTSLTLTGGGTFVSEIAWSGSGGGLSVYETEPFYQVTYGVHSAFGFRAVPDVSYNADVNNTAFSIYISLGLSPGFYPAGGTSAGAPQWAAIRALGGNKIVNSHLYQVAGSPTLYANNFRDITSGSNSSPGFYTTATTGYDYVTGLGSPLGTGLFQTGVENWRQLRFDLDEVISKE